MATENGKPRTAEAVVQAYAKQIGDLEVEGELLKEENELLESRLAAFQSSGAPTGDGVVHRGSEHDP